VFLVFTLVIAPPVIKRIDGLVHSIHGKFNNLRGKGKGKGKGTGTNKGKVQQEEEILVPEMRRRNFSLSDPEKAIVCSIGSS
jgi:hypothetical protein